MLAGCSCYCQAFHYWNTALNNIHTYLCSHTTCDTNCSYTHIDVSIEHVAEGVKAPACHKPAISKPAQTCNAFCKPAHAQHFHPQQSLPLCTPAHGRCAAPRQQPPPWLPQTRLGSTALQQPQAHWQLARSAPACWEQRGLPRLRRPCCHACLRRRRRRPSRACRAAPPLPTPQPRTLRTAQFTKVRFANTLRLLLTLEASP